MVIGSCELEDEFVADMDEDEVPSELELEESLDELNKGKLLKFDMRVSSPQWSDGYFFGDSVLTHVLSKRTSSWAVAAALELETLLL
jgi:hypothetical protein